MLRSSYYGLGYAANDIVLVVLWVLASCEDPAYIPVAVNFGIFLFHDFYGFLSGKSASAIWPKLHKNRRAAEHAALPFFRL